MFFAPPVLKCRRIWLRWRLKWLLLDSFTCQFPKKTYLHSSCRNFTYPKLTFSLLGPSPRTDLMFFAPPVLKSRRIRLRWRLKWPLADSFSCFFPFSQQKMSVERLSENKETQNMLPPALRKTRPYPFKCKRPKSFLLASASSIESSRACLKRLLSSRHSVQHTTRNHMQLEAGKKSRYIHCFAPF